MPLSKQEGMKNEKDLVYTCRKCDHRLYVSGWEDEKKMKKILKMSCPNCGEEPYNLWILTAFGVFQV